MHFLNRVPMRSISISIRGKRLSVVGVGREVDVSHPVAKPLAFGSRPRFMIMRVVEPMLLG